jgi:hypothetical protein
MANFQLVRTEEEGGGRGVPLPALPHTRTKPAADIPGGTKLALTRAATVCFSRPLFQKIKIANALSKCSL